MVTLTSSRPEALARPGQEQYETKEERLLRIVQTTPALNREYIRGLNENKKKVFRPQIGAHPWKEDGTLDMNSPMIMSSLLGRWLCGIYPTPKGEPGSMIYTAYMLGYNARFSDEY